MSRSDRRRRAAIASAVAGSLFGSIGSSMGYDAPALARRGVAQLSWIELQRIAVLAGLRDHAGHPTVTAALPVAVHHQGSDPAWVVEAVADVVAGDPSFSIEESAPNRIVAEPVVTDGFIAVRLQLQRRGWNLGAGNIAWMFVSPWVATLSAAFGIAAGWVRGRLGLAALVAGVTAQLALLAHEWPTAIPALWAEGGPSSGLAVQWLRWLAMRLPADSLAWGLGIVVACTILIAFDHRRSRRRGGWALVWTVLGMVGLAGWIEASVRAGASAWLGTGTGVVAAVALSIACAGLFLRRLQVRRRPLRNPDARAQGGGA
jgi:hypothetical protein